MSRLTALIDAMVFARGYTLELLRTIPESDWFTMPAGCPTHVRWQAAHLAVAQARLVLWRACDRDFTGEGLLPESYVQRFGRDSTAVAGAAANPSPAEIRQCLSRVHDAALRLASALSEHHLDTPSPGPRHRFCVTRADYLRWASHHELLHAGQIGLIRRMLGQPPVW